MKATAGMIIWTVALALIWSACQTEEPFRSEQTTQQRAEQKQATQKRAAEKRRAEKRAEKRRATEKRAEKRRAQKRAEKRRAASGASATAMLSRLPVRAESGAGYDRDAFEHWSDLDGNGCDGREDVLRQENLRPQGSDCWDDRGMWFSAYDGERTSDAGSFDVDHVVPLAEAWDSGASRWSDLRREQYANDPWPLSLRAVTASSNRSKSDSDPADWMPPRESFHCRYALEWIAVKTRWGLATDPVEKVALGEVIRDCPGLRLSALPPRA